jgi:3-hydroxybutyryl-CoA dehydrogenase
MAGEPIAVVGAGLMGHGIAQVFAVAGHPVRITDESAAALATVHERVRRNLERIGGDTAAVARIEPCASLEQAVEGAAFVTEAVAEDLPLKRALFAKLDAATAPETILASNTSVISIGAIAADSTDPGRIVGTHWWNPPHLIPLVEVTQAQHTRPDVVERAMALLASVGKEPVHVRKDVPGFIGNRMQHALWREAIALVESGVADAADVDRVVKTSFGLRLSVLGPLENADLIGLEMTRAIHGYVLPHLDARPAPSPLLDELIDRGDLGMATGRGLRTWDGGEADAVRDLLFDHLVEVTSRP